MWPRRPTRSTATTYTYDALNRVTAATVTDGTVTYEYDNTTTGGPYAKGRLTKVTDPSGFTTYAYDALGRVTAKAQTTNAVPASKAFTVGYTYASGRQSGLTYPSAYSGNAGPAFRFMPGQCVAGELCVRRGGQPHEQVAADGFRMTVAVFRLYNDRARFNDSNHRFVVRPELYAEMMARGWIGEGVTMCLPQSLQ